MMQANLRLRLNADQSANRAFRSPKALSLAIFSALLAVANTLAQDPQRLSPGEIPATNNPSYHLTVGDTIQVSVEGEIDAGTTQILDPAGFVRLVYLDNPVNLDGLTRRQAEEKIRQSYIDGRIYRSPKVNVIIVGYAPREVYLNGEFNNPVAYRFPPGVEEMEISELITRAGGMTVYANKKRVEVTRGDTGEQFTVNVQAIQEGDAVGEQEVIIYPGDSLYVRQRLL